MSGLIDNVSIVRVSRAPETWRTIPKASQGATWSPADLSFSALSTLAAALVAEGLNRLFLWFYLAGIAADATADIQIAGWPVGGSVNSPKVAGVAFSSSAPHGRLIADGQLAFDYQSPVTKNPITGATETWYPGHAWTSQLAAGELELVEALGSVPSPAAGKAQPVILEIADLKHFQTLALQADSLPTGSTLLAIVAGE